MMNNNYDDLLYKEHHQSKTHSKMSLYDRAAQFAPFAALTGYADAINETGRIVEQKKILDEIEQEKIASKLFYLNSIIKEKNIITFIYFVNDSKKIGGTYKSYNGIIKRIDDINKFVLFDDKKKIMFDDILCITGNVFDKFEE